MMCKDLRINKRSDFDYSLLTANTGITTISTANPLLNGTGPMQEVIMAAGNGTIIRSVIIKAAAPDDELLDLFYPSGPGMVRLFIGPSPSGGSMSILATAVHRSLYKEVPIPVQPSMPALSLPLPILPQFEIKLIGGLKLEAGYSLYASTQFAFPFNVFAEGLDWAYPETLPTVCCTFIQKPANTGMGVIADDTIVPIFTAGSGANGSTIKAITIKALQSTHEGLVSLYVSPDSGTTWYLMQEVQVPQTAQSAYVPSFKHVVEMDYNLKAGYMIGAASYNTESFALTVEGVDWSYL